jgi:hypothetical protein
MMEAFAREDAVRGDKTGIAFMRINSPVVL